MGWLWEREVVPSLPFETWKEPVRRTVVDIHCCTREGDWNLQDGRGDSCHIECDDTEAAQE